MAKFKKSYKNSHILIKSIFTMLIHFEVLLGLLCIQKKNCVSKGRKNKSSTKCNIPIAIHCSDVIAFMN